jgi:gliding motility-associated protein GldE
LDVGWLYRIITLIILLIFSAIFSGSEVALFSLDNKKLDGIKSNSKLIGKYISSLLEYPRRLLVTILIGNTIFNVAASIISVTLALDVAKKYHFQTDMALLIQIIVLTISVIIFAEISPKVWANKHPINFSKLIAFPLYWTHKFLSPISKALSNSVNFFTKKIKIDKTKTALSNEEITELADIVIEKGTIIEEEHELIHGLVAFKSVTVREVMTPRVDMTAISKDISFNELLDVINASGHSRIPVYQDDLDNILGIIYAKDILPFLKKNNNKFSLDSIIREASFVPETKLISKLMQEFQEKKMHISIVVDEYGGTSGVISLEDILEEIVGEIRDEHDAEENEITKISDAKFIVLGKVNKDELEELLNIQIKDAPEDYDTLGGYIFNHAGTIPEVGYNFEEYGFRFTVKEVENNRINKVEIEKVVTQKEQTNKEL